VVVAQVCYRLDGIPLGLELAAARAKVLSAEQIASRLDERFGLLSGWGRTALPHQRTLRAKEQSDDEDAQRRGPRRDPHDRCA
jgi:predicted ATPase